MKLRSLILLAALFLVPQIARAQVCPANITAVGGQTSCWVPAVSTPSTISDVTDGNPLTIQGDSSFTLPASGGINCQGVSGGPGCDLTSLVSYSNPQPITLVMSFSGTGGPLAQFGSTSSVFAQQQFYELYLDSYGRISWGVNNYGNLNVLQSRGGAGPFVDGNPHIVVVSIGPAGMNIYADGAKIGTQNSQLANYSQGAWYFGGAVLQGNPPTGNTWPNAPAQQWFNGTINYAAWWNGTQLTDAQAIGVSLPGGAIQPITNNYSTITGSIASLVPPGYAYAKLPVTFKTTTAQNSYLPGCNSTVPLAPSTQTVYTDSMGNIPAGTQLPQGAHVNMMIGNTGPPVPLVIPCQASTPIYSTMVSQTTPDPVVSQVNVVGPAFAGNVVTNPTNGQIGPATITAPATFSQTQASAATVDIQNNGNLQQVVMTGNVGVALTDFFNGASFTVTTTENGVGGFSPTFTVPVGWTLVWASGLASQPTMPTLLPNASVVWTFVAVNSTTLIGYIDSSANSGGFPLTTDVSASNFSIQNIGGLAITQQSPPSNLIATATCSGTCATTYTYDVTCLTGIGETTPSAVTATNAASLSGSNFNTLTWTVQPSCTKGYRVYGRISGSLNLLTTVAPNTGTYQDTGTAAGGPTYTFNFSGAASPVVAMWDLRGATVGGNIIDQFATNTGTNTGGSPLASLAVAPSVTTSANHSLEIPVFAYANYATGPGSVAGAVSSNTPPVGFSNVINLPSVVGQSLGIWGGTLDIASPGATGAQNDALGTSGALLSTTNAWNAMNVTVLSTGSAITVIGKQSTVSASPYNSISFGDIAGANTNDVEIGFIAYNGTITSNSPQIVPLLTTQVGGQMFTWFAIFPQTATQPPTTSTASGLTESTVSFGAFHEYLIGLFPWMATTLKANLNTTNPDASLKLPVSLTVLSCRATWSPFTACSPFPVYAVKDITAGAVLCSTGTVTNASVDQNVVPTNTFVPANDVVQFLATTAGTSCTAGDATMDVIFHQ